MFSMALFKLSLRQVAGRHRWFALFFLILLAALPAILAGLLVSFAPESTETSLALFEGLTLTLVLPGLALLIGANVLREEVRNQTIDYIYLKPISRLGIVLSKFAGASVLVLVLAVLSVTVSAAVFGDSRVGVFLTAGAMAALAYGAVFFALSLFLNRVVLWGFGYLLLWERFLSNISQPASYLSVRRYVLSFAQALMDRRPEPPLEVSLIVLVAITIFFLSLAVWRLRAMEFPGGTE